MRDKVFKRPYTVVEKVFERVALVCDKATSGRITECTTCKEAGTQKS